MRILAVAAHLALALWIGSIACVAFLVAPSAFAVHGDDTSVAADLLRPVFQRVDYFGIATAILLLLACAARWQRVLAALMGLSACASVFFLAPRVSGKGRNVYHHVAEGLWGFLLIAGLVLLAVGYASTRAKRSSG